MRRVTWWLRMHLPVPLGRWAGHATEWALAHSLCLIFGHRAHCTNPYGELFCKDCGEWLDR
jgi:hypothetical protein